MEFPKEIRDEIYTQALSTDAILVELDFKHPKFHSTPEPQGSPITALLRVSKTVSTEAAAIFYSINTFEQSTPYNRPISSVFKTHAEKFRKLILSFDDRATWQEKESGSAWINIMMQGFKAQIESLPSMTNLEYLQLNVSELQSMDFGHRSQGCIGNRDQEDNKRLFQTLKPLLLSCVPLSLRNKPGIPERGIWIGLTSRFHIHSGSISSAYQRQEVGMLWYELGINFKIPEDRATYRGRESNDSTNAALLSLAPAYYDEAFVRYLSEMRSGRENGCTCGGLH